jgi:antitoxin HicB
MKTLEVLKYLHACPDRQDRYGNMTIQQAWNAVNVAEDFCWLFEKLKGVFPYYHRAKFGATAAVIELALPLLKRGNARCIREYIDRLNELSQTDGDGLTPGYDFEMWAVIGCGQVGDVWWAARFCEDLGISSKSICDAIRWAVECPTEAELEQVMGKKSLNECLDVLYPVLIHPEENGGFTASIPDLPGCVTQGETIEETWDNIQDARAAWIETAYRSGDKIPDPKPGR